MPFLPSAAGANLHPPLHLEPAVIVETAVLHASMNGINGINVL